MNKESIILLQNKIIQMQDDKIKDLEIEIAKLKRE
jgi:hypothetical protein